jgi:hypothetical protein
MFFTSNEFKRHIRLLPGDASWEKILRRCSATKRVNKSTLLQTFDVAVAAPPQSAFKLELDR